MGEEKEKKEEKEEKKEKFSYREKSLEQMAGPENIHDFVKITKPRIWIAVIGCLLVIGTAAAWSFLGNIPHTVSTTGIVFPGDGTVPMLAARGGRIYDIRVQTGDLVYPNQLLAVIPQPEIIEEIQQLQREPEPDLEEIERLKDLYIQSSRITSQVMGTVLYAKHLNEMVEEGERVITLARQESSRSDYSIIAYVEENIARNLATGMEAQVSPAYASREEYGYMYGYINYVGHFPVTQEDIRAATGDHTIPGLPENENLIEVQVTIEVDSETGDGFNYARWSNPRGNELSVTIGTACDIIFVINELKPYELLF